MFDGKKIVCIAPCYNELHKIDRVVERVLATDIVDEMLVVDDGSTDGSPDVARALGARVIPLGRTIGVGAAIRRGIEHALQNGFDIVVIIAGNNKDEPREIERLVQPLTRDEFDFVQGSRFARGGVFGDMPLYRILATRIHPMLFSLVSGKWVTESTNGFRAFKTLLFEDTRINLWQSWLDEYELEPYLYYKVIRLGYRTTEVPVTKIYPPKKLGYTKMKPVTGWWSILRPLILLGLGLRK
ncbi:MAG: glycosyltransferase family 2 protein [Deltaproteobacteria bacterium]|nr:glycosyltransferase family 2 protein [Deltaproteobacteria bacterium]